MTPRRPAVLLLALALLPLALAPTAAASHICQPDEPEWRCEHRNPTPDELWDEICPTNPIFECDAVGALA